MNDFQRMGGITALIHSAAYLFAIGLYLSVLSPVIDAAPSEYLALLIEYQSLMYVWIFVAYWVSAFCLIVVALAFFNLLRSRSTLWLQTGTVLGLIWAGLIIASGNLMLHDFGEVAAFYQQDPVQSETVWLALGTVENGLISGNELIGGLWVLIISWVALQEDYMPRSLNYLGVFIGVAGIVSIVPLATEIAVMMFGLSMIVWFGWVGIFMLRSTKPAAEVESRNLAESAS